jgi:VanZ family protein
LWLFIGYLMIAVVVYLSLTSEPVDVDTGLPYEDKLFHLLAYFCLTFWFMQLYHIKHHVYFWVVLFIGFGVLLEYLQGYDANRYSEFGDMVANTVGVMAAFMLSSTHLKFVLQKFEHWIGLN